MKEIELIQECKKNNYAAQMQVYNLFKNQLYNASWRILKNKQDAEDAMQDAFIKGFQKIDQIKDDANLGGWFKRIVINHSLDLLRKRKKLKIDDVEIKDIGEEVAEMSLSEDDVVTSSLIKYCIDCLDKKYRIILILYLIEDYSHREISEQLGLNESTVRNQFRRGKSKLVQLIQKHKAHEFEGLYTRK